ncbi:MAG: DUF58 domain-containing protein [Myxococcales bacterium]|nr:DUF58 domain-containing protein [Myxococcales bacterium]
MAADLDRTLRDARQIELRALRALDSTRSGHFRSVFLGHGMELEQVREYVPGDDVRHIDWNATARSGRPFVKVHVEERDLTVLLVLDVSPSSAFGTVGSTKRERMAELAAVLAFAALRGDDRVGLVLFSDHVEAVVPPGRGRAHVLSLVRRILAHEPTGRSTRIAPALEHLRALTPRRAAVFLVSDLFTPDEDPAVQERALRVAALKHEVVAVRCTDALEEALPDVGWLVVEDAETGELVELDTSSTAVRERYAAEADAHHAEIVSRLRRCDVDVLHVRTDRPWVPALGAFLSHRVRRNR